MTEKEEGYVRAMKWVIYDLRMYVRSKAARDVIEEDLIQIEAMLTAVHNIPKYLLGDKEDEKCIDDEIEFFDKEVGSLTSMNMTLESLMEASVLDVIL